jgi:hypothetical protein
MVRTQIQLTEEQAKAVREVAKSRHLSVAELIRQAIDMVIISNKAVDINELRKRATDIAGKFSSDRDDVSREHDTYLSEAFKK